MHGEQTLQPRRSAVIVGRALAHRLVRQPRLEQWRAAGVPRQPGLDLLGGHARLHRRKLAQRAALRPAGLAHLVCGSVGRRRRGSPRPQNPLEAHKIYPQASAGKTRSPWNKDRRYHCAPAGRLVQKRSGQQFFLIQSSPFSTDTHMCAADPKVLTSSLSTPNQTL